MKKKQTNLALSVIAGATEHFIHFLRNEFAAADVQTTRVSLQPVSRVAVKPKERKNAPAQNGYERILRQQKYDRISHLLNQALTHLQDDASEQPKGDLDERSAQDWQAKHGVVAKHLLLQQKAAASKHVSKDKAVKRTGFVHDLALPAVFALMVSICSVCLSPLETARFVASIDDAVFGLRSGQNTIDYLVKNNPGLNSLNDQEVAAAKALYIIKNQQKIDGHDEVGVTFNELFRQTVGAQENLPETETNGPSSSQTEEISKFTKISETVMVSWINFFNELSAAQEKLFSDSKEAE